MGLKSIFGSMKNTGSKPSGTKKASDNKVSKFKSMSKKMYGIAFLLLTLPTLIYAQANPSSRLGWDQPATTLAEASGYTYKYYANTATTGINFTGVTCVGTTAPFNCSAPFPAFTPGSHTIQITASNVAGESAKSAVFSFTFVVVPGIPVNIRIQ